MNEEHKNNIEKMRAEALALADIVSDGQKGLFTNEGVDPKAYSLSQAARPEMYRLFRQLAEIDPDHYKPKPGDRVRHRRRGEPGYDATAIDVEGLLTEEGAVVHSVEDGIDLGIYLVGFKTPQYGDAAVTCFTSPYLERVP